MKNQTASLPISSAKKSTLSLWLNRENEFISTIVEEKVTNKQMLLLFNACTSLSILGFSVFYSIISLLLCFFWFLHSLYLCRKGGLK